jgi:hypothetical protein
MEFYLNQKSMPMIRKCANCRFYNANIKKCSKVSILNAYDHCKIVYLNIGDNLYCDKHEYNNEQTLKNNAIIVEYNSVKEAMEVIQNKKP